MSDVKRHDFGVDGNVFGNFRFDHSFERDGSVRVLELQPIDEVSECFGAAYKFDCRLGPKGGRAREDEHPAA